MWDALPEDADRFVQRLHGGGFVETRREPGTMDSGLITFRRDPVEITLVKDRSQWSLDLGVDGWRGPLAFPLLDGCGIPHLRGDDSLAPRRDRDPARRYDVPPPVRWLIRQLLGAGLADRSRPGDQSRVTFRREPLTVRLQRDPGGWSVHLGVDGWDDEIALPPFEEFAGP